MQLESSKQGGKAKPNPYPTRHLLCGIRGHKGLGHCVLVYTNGSLSVTMSMNECSAALKGLCIPKEMNRQRRSQVIVDRLEYLRRYYSKNPLILLNFRLTDI